MRKLIFVVAPCLAVMGVALAQIEASSSTYFLDVDPARYAGPPGQRLVVQLGDQPRQLALNSKDEICVQLRRAADSGDINAHVRVLRPEPHDEAVVRVAGTDISPGTFRSTPWGMLLRVVTDKSANTDQVKPLGLAGAPVCSL